MRSNPIHPPAPPRGAMRARIGRHWSTGAVAVSLCALVGAALVHPGIHRTDLDLNDGGIWITNQSQHLVGRLNYPSKEIDAVLRTPSSSFDVTQNAEDVFVPDSDSSSVSAVDTTSIGFSEKTQLEPGTAVLQGGDRVVLVNRSLGTVRAATASSISALTGSEPILSGAEGLVAAAGTDGSIHAVNAKTRTVSVVAALPAGGWAPVSESQIDVQESADLAITAVGEFTVVLDRGDGTVHLPDGTTVSLNEPGLALQQPGPSADAVLLASRTALISVPLDGSSPTTTPAGDDPQSSGAPAQPVRLGHCAYGAWSGTGSFLRACGGAPAERMRDDALAASARPVFRVNRDVVVLNDVTSGSVWTLDKELTLVDNWTSATAQTSDDSDTRDNAAETSTSTAPPDRTEENHPPVANDDAFGARPGRSTTLPVLANDSDQDGDVLTAIAGDHGSKGEVTAVRSGRALQLDLPDDASGSVVIPYSADDGRGLTASAVATVEIHPWDENHPPEQQAIPSLDLTEGASGTIDVLSHWTDPDGDALALVSAAGDGFDLRWTAEGRVAVHESSGGVGNRTVTLVVSDGIETATGRLSVNVVPESEAAPVANADHVRVVAGSPITVSPLSNDASPSGGDLKLAQVQEAPHGTRIDVDQGAGTFTFVSDEARTYYLDYGITDGPGIASGIVRVDVTAKADSTVPPAVENDTAMLRDGGSATIAPLANDFDPVGGVLVLQSVEVPDDAHVTATIVDHSLLQLSTADSVERSSSVSYTVTNGTATATGTIALIPMEESALQAPRVEPDRAVVRVDDIATIAVLDNDSSPSGLVLSLGGEVVSSDPELGEAWVNGTDVRFKAGSAPGRTTVTYTAVDEHGQENKGVLDIEVVARDDNANTAPHPVSLEARAVVGSTTPIAIPLTDIDRDGDSVTLVGVDQPPSLGTVGAGATWLTYTPASGAVGTDTFTYKVEDRFGASASATIRVGIAPALSENHAPEAVDDIVTVRPGRVVAIDPVINDIDSDGDSLSLASTPVAADPALGATTREGRILLTAPEAEGVHAVRYTVTDSRGGTDIGTVTVEVKADAPNLGPAGMDDVVALESIDAEGHVRVDVLSNDSDPDGSPWDLTVSTDDPSAGVDGDELLVTIGDEWRLVMYTITDVDGLSGRAAVVVPGVSGLRPRVDAGSVPVRVPADETTLIDLSRHIVTRAGTSPIVTDPTTIRTGAGSGGATGLKDPGTVTFTPDQGFSGATSITLVVADGTGADALSETLTLPVLVVSESNTPPAFTPTSIDVGIGEEPVIVDLAEMSKDPDSDPISYSIGEIPDGFIVSLAGSRLTVSAADGAQAGTTGALPVTLDDASSSPTTGAIPMTVVDSSRPLITLSDPTLRSQGEPVSVDVSTLATNPFPDKPISLYSVPRVASGSGSVSASGTVLTISPDAGFAGRLVAEYRVLDATGNPARAVRGTVTVVVAAAPESPRNVRATPRGAQSMTVTWTDGADNGSPIRGYTVKDASRGTTWECAASPCQATGLTAGETYSFQVVARNDAGASAPSTASSPTVLTVTPGAPSTPRLTGGNGELVASWTPSPPIEGATIRYELELSNGTQRSATVSPERFAVPPGTYTLKIRAVADGGGASAWVSSTAENVYGAPGAPDTPRVSSTQDGLNVSWAPAQANGDPVTYTVAVTGAAERTVSAGAETSASIGQLPAGSYTVTVTASNRGGSATSAPASARIVTTPAAPSVPAFQATGASGMIRASSAASPHGGGGWAASELRVEYRVMRGGAAVTEWTSDTTFSSLVDGQEYTVQARASGQGDDGTTVYSQAVESSPVTPYGPPSAPSVSCSATSSSQVACTWTPGASGGLSPTAYWEADNPHGTGSQRLEAGTVKTINAGAGKTVTWCVAASNTAGQYSPWACANATTSVLTGDFRLLPNVPEAQCSAEDVAASGIPAQQCRRMVIDVRGFAPNSTVSCGYHYAPYHGAQTMPYDESFNVDAAGSARHVFPHRLALSAILNGYSITCTQQ
ncbi:Ig-like domain-containing protein [Actinomyces sp. B33]|uniref:Ig-like domain-containing protein n=1 Tax=Actinomyces sp. B33 TaxID=2942131 RepID=UPI0023422699|nr:Ig-like domain-containing protein [Actinomyces sp. B33]MDC4233627.1 Ig-like domain-containing protein [Actinomyces sp. B33]